MRAWILAAGTGRLHQDVPRGHPDPTRGPGEVLIQVHACSINYRDFAVAAGKYFGGALKAPAIPLSTARPGRRGRRRGHALQGRRPGAERVLPDVGGRAAAMGPALGDGFAPGMLAELVVLPEAGVVPMAASLDYRQAACLPCAA
jgi:NADPH:quinone reductase-like Zn-dependent oxidoreductase